MVIWIHCPTLDRAISTGIGIDKRSFDMLPAVVKGMACNACGQRHDWHKDEAWLADDCVPASDGEKRGVPRKVAQSASHSPGSTVHAGRSA